MARYPRFILTDPPTSPVKYRDQVVCGVLVAVVSYAVFTWVGVVYFLLAGVVHRFVYLTPGGQRRGEAECHGGG